MRKKVIGLLLLTAIMLVSGGIYLLGQRKQAVTVSGYLGGEKIGFFEDEERADILKERYGLEADYSKAGSLDMITADLEGRDYLFPSSSIALEYYEDLHGKPLQNETILNTPIVLYTHRIVLDALVEQGAAETVEDVNYVDMNKLVDLIQKEIHWKDIGVEELYGKVSVDTTDPASSNSGNMFAALLADILNGGETPTQADLGEVLPKLQDIFGKLGYMETSSADLFSQFLKMGVGATPIAAGYESQIIEYAVMEPEDYQAVKDDIVILYPTPTVWSTHVMIALDENGQALLEALLDEEIQELAWDRHGFRTESGGSIQGDLPVSGIAPSITSVAPIPDYEVMKQIIDGLA